MTNIHNDYGLSFKQSTNVAHVQCPPNFGAYLACNVGMQTEWLGSTPIFFYVGDVAPKKS